MLDRERLRRVGRGGGSVRPDGRARAFVLRDRDVLRVRWINGRFLGRIGAVGPLALSGGRSGGCGPFLLLFLLAGLLRLHGEEALPVGDRDLVVVGMDFAESEEAVAVAAVFDERRLKARLYPYHLGEIDISLELLLGRCLDVEILKPRSVQNHDTGLFRVRGVDQHALGH